MNKSFDRVNGHGDVYSQTDADSVVEKWTEIAKGLIDSDLKKIQKDLTSKCNSRENGTKFPDEFLNSREIAYRVAGVVTAELMARRQAKQYSANQKTLRDWCGFSKQREHFLKRLEAAAEGERDDQA